MIKGGGISTLEERWRLRKNGLADERETTIMFSVAEKWREILVFS